MFKSEVQGVDPDSLELLWEQEQGVEAEEMVKPRAELGHC